MGRKIRWTFTALRERQEIFDYWNKRNRGVVYSRRSRRLIKEKLIVLAIEPHIGSLTDEVSIYKKLLRNYNVIYQVSETTITVLSVWDTRSNPDEAPYPY